VASPVGLLATIAPGPPIYASAESRKTDGSDCLESAITALRPRSHPVFSNTCRFHAESSPSLPATLNSKRLGLARRKALVKTSLAARGRIGRVHASRNVRELVRSATQQKPPNWLVSQPRFRAPDAGSGSKLASFRNYPSVHPAPAPAQNWLRSAITLHGPGGGSDPQLASFRNYASPHPAAAPAQDWLRSAITLPWTRGGSDPGLASFRTYASVHPAAAPAQNWLRSPTTLPCTRQPLQPRIGFVPQLHPAPAPAQNWLRSPTTLPRTRRRLRLKIGFVPQLRSMDPAAAPTQDWLRSAITLPRTRRPAVAPGSGRNGPELRRFIWPPAGSRICPRKSACGR
jgi:hypothetical protein